MTDTIKLIIIILVSLVVYHFLIAKSRPATEPFAVTTFSPAFVEFVQWFADGQYSALQTLLSNVSVYPNDTTGVIQFNKSVKFNDNVTMTNGPLASLQALGSNVTVNPNDSTGVIQFNNSVKFNNNITMPSGQYVGLDALLSNITVNPNDSTGVIQFNKSVKFNDNVTVAQH